MKCDDARPRLIESLYGELSPDEESSLRGHLAGCQACGQEMAGLEQSRRHLTRLDEPRVQVDLNRLYCAAADRAQRSRQRWRRLAVATTAAALVVTVTLAAARLHVEWRPDRVTISWGAGVPEDEAAEPRAPDPSAPLGSPYEERLAALEEVAQLFSAELMANDARDAATTAELGRLARWQRGIGELARQSNQRWQLATRDIEDLYHLTQLSPDSDRQGVIP